MQTVTVARDAERWEPDIRSAFTARANRKRRFWTLGVSTVAAAFVASLAVHAFVASRIVAPAPLGRDAAAVATAFHVTLERRPGVLPARSGAHALPVPRLVVVHNVVTLARPVAAPPPAMHVAVASPRSASGNAQRPAPPAFIKSEQVAALRPSRHDEGTIAAMQTAATANPAAQRAESIAVVPTIVHDVVPLGGEDAIVPHPSAIAYDEGAQGTAAFDVNVDERGTPTKCTITKSSGCLVLDVSVCKAAMRARYVPRTVNGKALPASTTTPLRSGPARANSARQLGSGRSDPVKRIASKCPTGLSSIALCATCGSTTMPGSARPRARGPSCRCW